MSRKLSEDQLNEISRQVNEEIIDAVDKVLKKHQVPYAWIRFQYDSVKSEVTETSYFDKYQLKPVTCCYPEGTCSDL